MKKAILILSIVAIVAYVIGLVVVIGASATAASACGPNATQDQINAGCANGAVGGIAGGGLLFVLGVILSFVAWILGLIKSAQIGRWGWFVAIFFLTPIASLIYGITGPEERAQPAMAMASPPGAPGNPYHQ